MARRHTQIDDRRHHRAGDDNDRLTIDHGGSRKTSDIEATVKARLADTDGDTHIARDPRLKVIRQDRRYVDLIARIGF
jgi:hypothetical protein